MSPSALTIDAALKVLVARAGELHDLLAAGDWEGALVEQTDYDETFARFIALADRGETVAPELRPLLTSLMAVHDENLRLASELQASAREEVGDLTIKRRVGRAYAPLGANHRPGPRYIDGAA